MKAKLGQILFGTGMILLCLSMTFILAVLSTSPVLSTSTIIAISYLGVLISLLVIGSFLRRLTSETFTDIELMVCGLISILLTALLLDGGRLLRASGYALIPYFMLMAILALRWRRLSHVEHFLIRWSWLPFLVILTPIFHRAFEGKLIW